jgi:multidrug/hemolysin transport system ATP-binding protein
MKINQFLILEVSNLDKVIVVKGLHKQYGEVKAVKGIDFYVEKGKLFAFLGPNGAGKTTTINIICTLLSLNEGEVAVNGYQLGVDDDAIRDNIGIVFQDGVLDKLLTVKENLLMRGSFYHKEKKELEKAVEEALEVTSISDLKNRRYGSLSGGQKRRADIARALVHRPKILFLDEPTTGLDPQTRKNVWSTIQNLQRDTQMTVFLTTHYMEEADEADYVIIIDDGLIAAKGSPTDLKNKYSDDTLRVKPTDRTKVETILQENNIEYSEKNDLIICRLASTLGAVRILDLLAGNMESFQVLNGTMDDAFINITGKEIRE